MNERRSDDERDGSSSSDEEGGNEGGNGAPLNLTPRYGGKLKRRGTARQNEAQVEDTETDEKARESFYMPSLDELDARETLDNGYILGYLGGKWYLYDEDGWFVDEFLTREKAEMKAFERKPRGGFRI